MYRTVAAFSLALAAGTAAAHPNGTYRIDAQSTVTVTFQIVGRCPVGAGALTGSLRTLTFSEAAMAQPYTFESGHYVEIHEGDQEVYVQTDELCLPLVDGARIAASRDSFGGYALQRI